MFAAQLLLGGNPLAGAAGGVAAVAAISTFAYTMRKKVPHPTEFAPIGFCYLRGGCHTHTAFDLIIECHEAMNIPGGGKVYFYAEAGRFDARTGVAPVNQKTQVAELFERVNLHVRQKDDKVTIALWKANTIGSTLLGELDLSVNEDIVGADFPQLQVYTLKKDGKSTVRCYEYDFAVKGGAGNSSLVEYALIQAAREASERSKNSDGAPVAPPRTEFQDMDDVEKLRFLSRVLEGPLKLLRNAAWHEYHFKAVEGTKFRWSWKYWESKASMLRGDKPLGSIPLLAIATVLPDKQNRQQFYVKYYRRSGPEELFLRRVERDRDLWSDGLYEFLERFPLQTFLASSGCVETTVSTVLEMTMYRSQPLEPFKSYLIEKGNFLQLRMYLAERPAHVSAPENTALVTPTKPGAGLALRIRQRKLQKNLDSKSSTSHEDRFPRLPSSINAMVAEAMASYGEEDSDYDEEGAVKPFLKPEERPPDETDGAQENVADVRELPDNEDDDTLPIQKLEQLLRSQSAGAPA